MESLTNKNERLDKEVLGLLGTTRTLERENGILKDRVANVEHAMVWALTNAINYRKRVNLRWSSWMAMG